MVFEASNGRSATGRKTGLLLTPPMDSRSAGAGKIGRCCDKTGPGWTSADLLGAVAAMAIAEAWLFSTSVKRAWATAFDVDDPLAEGLTAGSVQSSLRGMFAGRPGS
jgi:hypothetical protein